MEYIKNILNCRQIDKFDSTFKTAKWTEVNTCRQTIPYINYPLAENVDLTRVEQLFLYRLILWPLVFWQGAHSKKSLACIYQPFRKYRQQFGIVLLNFLCGSTLKWAPGEVIDLLAHLDTVVGMMGRVDGTTHRGQCLPEFPTCVHQFTSCRFAAFLSESQFCRHGVEISLPHTHTSQFTQSVRDSIKPGTHWRQRSRPRQDVEFTLLPIQHSRLCWSFTVAETGTGRGLSPQSAQAPPRCTNCCQNRQQSWTYTAALDFVAGFGNNQPSTTLSPMCTWL